MAVISGIVRDRAGKPVAEARVYVAESPEPMPDVAMLSGEDGTFRVGAPAPGTYVIRCTSDDLGSGSATVNVPAGKAGTATVEVTLGG